MYLTDDLMKNVRYECFLIITDIGFIVGVGDYIANLVVCANNDVVLVILWLPDNVGPCLSKLKLLKCNFTYWIHPPEYNISFSLSFLRLLRYLPH